MWFLARYAHGDRVDQPLAMSRGGQDYYIQADHQGSVIRVTDSAGAVVNSYTYDAYGQRLSATEGVEIAFGYTGREYDAESGLMHYRARVYDPAMGRFLQTDPLRFGAGDLNLYRYVYNDPVNLNDPSGLKPCTCIALPLETNRIDDMKICTYRCTCSCPKGEQTEEFQFPAGTEDDAVCEGQSVFLPGYGLTPQLHTRPFSFDTESIYDRFLDPLGPSGEFQDFVDELFQP